MGGERSALSCWDGKGRSNRVARRGGVEMAVLRVLCSGKKGGEKRAILWFR